MATLTYSDSISGETKTERGTCAFSLWMAVFERVSVITTEMSYGMDMKHTVMCDVMRKVLDQNWDESGELYFELADDVDTAKLTFTVDASPNMCGKTHDISIPDSPEGLTASA